MIVEYQAPATELYRRLSKSGYAHSDKANTLLLVSLSVLPVSEAEDGLWPEFDAALGLFKNRYSAAVYRLSDPDRAILVESNEYNSSQMNTDLKVALLRLIQNYFPNHFGLVDQSRLLRTVDLKRRHANALSFVKRYIGIDDEDEAAAAARDKAAKAETAQSDTPATTEGSPAQSSTTETKPDGSPAASASAAGGSGKRRPLGEPDIRMVEQVTGEIGPTAFAKIFLKHQLVVRIQPGSRTPTPVFEEIFVAMNALKNHVFQNVELRGSGNIFNQLTITLDRLLVGALDEANPTRKPCSINLNVESVFSRDFQEILDRSDEDAFAHVTFEFRQSNILQHFDEFSVALALIEQRKGTIAVDAIFPETLGIVNVDRVGAKFAKVFWRTGANMELDNRAVDITRMLNSGVEPVLARLDDPMGIELAHDLGITLFQGFYIDDFLER